MSLSSLKNLIDYKIVKDRPTSKATFEKAETAKEMRTKCTFWEENAPCGYWINADTTILDGRSQTSGDVSIISQQQYRSKNR